MGMWCYSKEAIKIMTDKRSFVCDLDDTLVTCGVHYETTKNKFYEYMTRLGMTLEEARYRFTWLEIHRRIRPDLTFQHYFPDNMTKVYREWCLEKQQAAVPEIEKEIRDIGYSVYACDFTPIPGAHAMLDQLSKEFTLYLYSKGEEPIQIKKILRAQLDGYFERVWITNQKTVKVLTKFMYDNKVNVRTTWVLGNSTASDILPAYEVGVPAHQLIWLDSYEWEEDKARLPEGVHKIHTLDEVVPLTKKVVVPV